MARRVDHFMKDRGDTAPRRYPWGVWMDGSIWEIRQGEDYDVATENMRVNLHERARNYGQVVRTEKVSDKDGEGLRFEFQRAPRRSHAQHRRYPIGDPRGSMPRPQGDGNR